MRHHAANQRRRGKYERGAVAPPQDATVGRGRRLRRIRHAGRRDARTRGGQNGRRDATLLHGIRAPGRTAGRIAGEEKGDGRQGDVERRRQGDIHVGQLETEEEIAHDQHVRARAVRELQRDPVERERRRHVPSTRPDRGVTMSPSNNNYNTYAR